MTISVPMKILGELLLSDGPYDITSKMSPDRDVEISRGSASDSESADTTTMTVYLDNNGGEFSVGNPYSPLHGKIGLFTPLRIAVIPGGPTCPEVEDDFNRTESNWWGRTPEGYLWIIYSDLNPSAPNSDWSVSGGTATMTVSGADEDRACELFLLDSVADSLDSTVAVAVPVATGDYLEVVTELYGSSYPHWQSVQARTRFNTDGTVSVLASWSSYDTASSPDQTTTYGPESTVSGVTHSGAGTPIWIRSKLTGSWVWIKVWEDGGSEPDTWALVYQLPSIYVMRLADLTLKSYRSAGNTNGSTDFEFSNFSVQMQITRNVGLVSRWEQLAEPTESVFRTVAHCTGEIERLALSGTVQSPMRRFFNDPDNGLSIVAYWPCEGASETMRHGAGFSSDVDNVGPIIITSGKTNGLDSGFVGSSDAPRMGTITSQSGTIPLSPPGIGELAMWMHVGIPDGGISSNTNIFTGFNTGTLHRIQVWLTSAGELELILYDANSSLITTLTSSSFIGEGEYWRLNIQFTQDGSDVVVAATALMQGQNEVDSLLIYTTVSSRTVGRWTTAGIGSIGEPDLSLAHVVLMDENPSIYLGLDELNGFSGEAPGTRFARVVQLDGTRCVLPDFSGYLPMGPLPISTQQSILDDIVGVEGTIFEDPATGRIRWISRAYRVDTSYYGTESDPLSVTSDMFSRAPQLKDRLSEVWNTVIIGSDAGSEMIKEESGPFNASPPPDGIGSRDISKTVNLATAGYLRKMAEWWLHVGTFPDPSATFELNLVRSADEDELKVVGGLQTADVLTVQGLNYRLHPYDINWMVQGIEEVVHPYRWTMSVEVQPGDLYRSIIASATYSDQFDLARSRADTPGTELSAAVSSTTSTSIDITVTQGAGWTTDSSYMPFNVLLSGQELCTVSAVTGTFPDYTLTLTRTYGMTHDSGAEVRLYRPGIALI